MKNGKRILTVTLKRMIDSDPDTSYLDQEEFKEWKKEFERDHFYFIGISAEATVAVCYGRRDSENPGNFTGGMGPQQTIYSGGLWGIESDSDSNHIAEIEKEQLGELREQLKNFGFSSLAISKAFKIIERKES